MKYFTDELWGEINSELREEKNFHDYKLKKSKYYMERMAMLTLLKFH